MIILVPSFETQNPWGISSAGRAPALHAGGQEFESPNLHHLKQVVLTKLAPRGAFLVCSSPVPHEQIIFCLNSVIPISAIPINIIFIKSHAQFVQFLP